MMTNQIPEEFSATFRSLVLAFQPRGLERDSVVAYYAALQRFPLDVLRDTALLLAESRRFFPTAGEWGQLANELEARRAAAGRRDEQAPCEWCAGYGLIRVTYRSDEPFDIAICTCLAGSSYRKAGEELVRGRLGLAPAHRIAWLEDFDGDDVPESVRPALEQRGFFVYAIRLGDQLKIGFSTNLARRYRDVCSRSGREGVFIGRAVVRSSSDARLLERWLQHRYGTWRLDGEYFQADEAFVRELHAMLSDAAAIEEQLRQARAARREVLARRPAQQNFRIIVAVAKEVVKAAAPAPAEVLVADLLARCAELRIAADEDIACHALRAAGYLVQRP